MIINYKNDIDLSSFYVVFEGSTMIEKKGEYGTSHLIEHLMCKGFDHLQDDFQRFNIKWNAYTSNTCVVFYISGLDIHVNRYKEDFLKLIIEYTPSEMDFENEKKIIIEEYKDSFNDQINNHYLNLERKLFNYYSPIGLKGDIINYKYNDFVDKLNLYYRKPSKIINISKNNPYKNDIRITDRIKQRNDFYFNKDVELELSNKYNNKSSIINFSPIMISDDDYPYIKFITKMLGSGLNSPLYKEIRENKGLTYYVSCFIDDITTDSYVISILTETSNDNVEEVQSMIYHILSNKYEYLTKDRFDIIKDNILVDIGVNDILIHENVNKFIKPDKNNFELFINDITYDKIMDIYDKYFIWDDFYKSVYDVEFNV